MLMYFCAAGNKNALYKDEDDELETAKGEPWDLLRTLLKLTVSSHKEVNETARTFMIANYLTLLTMIILASVACWKLYAINVSNASTLGSILSSICGGIAGSLMANIIWNLFSVFLLSIKLIVFALDRHCADIEIILGLFSRDYTSLDAREVTLDFILNEHVKIQRAAESCLRPFSLSLWPLFTLGLFFSALNIYYIFLYHAKGQLEKITLTSFGFVITVLLATSVILLFAAQLYQSNVNVVETLQKFRAQFPTDIYRFFEDAGYMSVCLFFEIRYILLPNINFN